MSLPQMLHPWQAFEYQHIRQTIEETIVHQWIFCFRAF